MLDLDACSRADLIHLILQPQGQIDQLRKQVEELRKTKGSAAPFSKGKRKENPKLPGRKPGQGIFRRRSEPAGNSSTPLIEVPVQETQCPFCGGELERELPEAVSQTDLAPDPRPEVRVFKVQVCRCRKCGRRPVRGKHPDVAAGNTGPRLTGWGRESRPWLIRCTTVTEFRYGGCRRFCGK